MISFAVKNCVSSTNKNKNELVQRQSLILLMTTMWRCQMGDFAFEFCSMLFEMLNSRVFDCVDIIHCSHFTNDLML